LIRHETKIIQEEDMKKISVAAAAIGVVSILALFFATDSFAQRGCDFKWRGSGGWGMGASYQRMYDPAKVETMKGSVEAIDTASPMKGMHRAVVLTLKSDKETIPVHLGPEWFIGRLDTKIQKGDGIEVKGSRVTVSDKPTLIAAEIKTVRDGQTIVLRDDAGIPVWAGCRRQ
jgi:hypothetical protein